MTDVFDEVAEMYDAVRPEYPEAVGDAIAEVISPDANILEIGMGTGQATKLLARRGYRMHCLEPGARLAAIAAKNLRDYPSVTIEQVTFENFQATPGQFDLILSATAFHWVSPEARYVKTAQALAEGGYLALVWNLPPDDEFSLTSDMQSVYECCAPSIYYVQRPLEERIQSWTDAINQSGMFEECTVLQFPWSEWNTTEQYLMLMDTYSNHRHLPEETKCCLYDGIAKVLEQNGGGLFKEYVAVLILAKKR